MAKTCRKCGYSNNSEMQFCSACGEPFDMNVKLIMDLEKRNSIPHTHRPEPVGDDDELELHPLHNKDAKKKKSAAPWIVLGIVVIAVILLIIFL